VAVECFVAELLFTHFHSIFRLVDVLPRNELPVKERLNEFDEIARVEMIALAPPGAEARALARA
jgi:hypothetical protein